MLHGPVVQVLARRVDEEQRMLDRPTDTARDETDERLVRGMRVQRERLEALYGVGAQRVGWKAGFGTAAWRESLGLRGPLVGVLPASATLPSGSTVDLTGWHAPRAEVELAVTIGCSVDGARLPAGPDGDAILRASIVAIAPAIELVDLDTTPSDVCEILAGNIYHRHVVLGTPDPRRAGGVLEGLSGYVHCAGAAPTELADLEASTGPALDVLREVARVATVHSTGLTAGDVVILGSIVPPMAIAPRDRLQYGLGAHAPLELHFA